MTPCPKTKTHRERKYTLWLRKQDCVACGQEPIEGIIDVMPAHKGGGIGIKGHDKEALPLCSRCHTNSDTAEHYGQKTFWALVELKTGKTRDQLAKQYYQKFKEGE